MPHIQNSSDAKFLYASLPALPVLLSGVAVGWQSGITWYGMLLGLLLVFGAIGCGLFLWRRHVDELTQINSRWERDEDSKIDAVVTYHRVRAATVNYQPYTFPTGNGFA